MKKPKKVLIYSIAYYPYVGGAEAAVKEITDRIKDIEWHMVTCLFDDTLSREEKIGNVFVHRVKTPKLLFPFVGAWKGYVLNKTERYDVVWSIMTFAGFAGLFFKLFHSKIKFLLTLQEGTPLSEIKREAFIVYPLFILMFKKADQIQAISHFLAGFGRDMGHKKEIVVIPNGVNLKHFTKQYKKSDVDMVKSKLGKKADDIYMITTSRLTHKNAVDDCIKALTYLPQNVSFLVVGVGEEDYALRKLAVECGVRDRVKFLGFMNQEDIPLFLAVSDIFVRPSRSEGFGNSFVEAMAAGLPVVATPVGGIPDFIDDRQTGIFCRPDNPKSLSEAVLELLHNPVMKEKIIQQGKDRAVSRYGWDVVVKDMREKVFNHLMVS